MVPRQVCGQERSEDPVNEQPLHTFEVRSDKEDPAGTLQNRMWHP